MHYALRAPLAVAAVAVLTAPCDAQSVTPAIRSWREQHEAAIVRDLADFVALPNVSADTANLRRSAEWIRANLARRGVAVRLLDNGPFAPVVFGELNTPGATRTVVFYAHYDGQPVDPREWITPPFQPTLRQRPHDDGSPGAVLPFPASGRLDPESRVYARSVSDDKAPIVGMLAALDAMRAGGIRPTVNVKFFFEGEEEAGSPHLKALLERNKVLLAADAWFFCDGPAHQSRQVQLVFGARGTMGLEMTVFGPARAMHSGHYGNWAPNPGALIAETIASMRDGDGRILIDHYADDVIPPTAAERAAVRAMPPVDAELRRTLLLGATEANDALLAERIMLPAINVRGIRTGQVGALAANAVPTVAQASFDFRLVPSQTPDHVRELVEAHLRKHGWFIVHEPPADSVRLAHPRVVQLDWEGGYAAVRTPMDAPVSRAVRQVVSEAIGHEAIAVPTLGGSLPMRAFADVLGKPLLIVPTVNHDNNQHAKDENLRLQNLWDGIEVYAALMARLGPVWSGPVP